MHRRSADRTRVYFARQTGESARHQSQHGVDDRESETQGRPLSARTTERMLANPELLARVRAVIQQYLTERSAPGRGFCSPSTQPSAPGQTRLGANSSVLLNK